MDNSERRAKLFEIYNRNLLAVMEHPAFTTKVDLEDHFVCPICLRVYSREALDSKEITLEHVPPGSLGGKVSALTCKSCNNYAGSSLEKDLTDEQKFLDFLRDVPGAEIDSLLGIDDATMRVSITIRKDQEGKPMWSFVGIPNASNPRYVEQINKRFETNRVSELGFSFELYRKRRPTIARLRIAYLIAFSNFGYAFALHPSMRAVQEQILNPDKEILNSLDRLKASYPSETIGLNLITAPPELRSFLVVFETMSLLGTTEKHGIILPGFSTNSSNIYHYIEQREANTPQQIQATHIEDDISDIIRARPFVAYELWTEFCSG